MDEYATKSDVQQIVNTAVTKAVDELSEVIKSFAQDVNARFDLVDKRFEKIDKDIEKLNNKYDHLITTLDAFLKRLDNIETDNIARDAQLARLERWIEQIAAKTGIKLEY